MDKDTGLGLRACIKQMKTKTLIAVNYNPQGNSQYNSAFP